MKVSHLEKIFVIGIIVLSVVQFVSVPLFASQKTIPAYSIQYSSGTAYSDDRKIDKNIRIDPSAYGWVTFDISEIPEGNTINSIKLYYTPSVVEGAPYVDLVQVISNTLLQSGSDIWNELNGYDLNSTPSAFYKSGVQIVGGQNSVILDATANQFVQALLAPNNNNTFFNIGFKLNGAYNAVTIIGYDNAQYRPYIEVDYSIPVGVEDYILFNTSPCCAGPTTITQNSIVTYPWSFIDVAPEGDYLVSSTTSILVKHVGGKYVAATGTSNIISFGTLPSGYNWSRDASGKVLAYVKAVGTDNDGIVHSANYDITISGVLPPASTALDPTNITSTSFTANWTDVSSGVTNYYLDVVLNDYWGNPLPGYSNLDVGNVTSYPVVNLLHGTTYRYRVRSYNILTSLNSNIMAVTTLPVTVSGTVAYAHTAVNAIGNTSLKLTPISGTALTATSAADGTYTFPNVQAGTYTLTASKSGNWGGVDGTDALLVQKHFLQITPLTDELKLAAGNVNGMTSVNNTDALMISRRIATLVGGFGAGDWVFKSQQVTVGTSNVPANISGLAVGDVNASYTPGSGNVFSKSVLASLKRGMDKFTICASSSGTYGAVTIWINVNSAKVAGITSKLTNFVSRVDDKGVIFVWFAEDGKTPVHFDANEAVVTVTLAEKTGEGGSVTVESALADIEGTEINNNLAVSTQGNIPLSFELKQNYPNPFNPSTQIDYDLPQTGMVTLTIYNMLGQEVTKLVNEQKNAGSYSVQWMPRNLASGMYAYRIRIQTEKETITSVKRLMLLK